jgi:hypothetical protein
MEAAVLAQPLLAGELAHLEHQELLIRAAVAVEALTMNLQVLLAAQAAPVSSS